jgi:hypothetical protein
MSAKANHLLKTKANSLVKFKSNKEEWIPAPGPQDPSKPSLANLPCELRSMIYDHMNEPRFVEIRYSRGVKTIYSPTKLPIGFFVHPESRYETKRWYHKRFAALGGKPNVYFDARFDTLYFGASMLPF